jgi:hypothetical protein
VTYDPSTPWEMLCEWLVGAELRFTEEKMKYFREKGNPKKWARLRRRFQKRPLNNCKPSKLYILTLKLRNAKTYLVFIIKTIDRYAN